MPDLRTVLTETQRSEIRDAISAHRLWNGRCEACGAVSRRESDHMADVVIETLAGLPGVAVTQLPEADESRDAFKREVAPMLLKWRYVLDQSAGDWAIAAAIFDELTKSGFTINRPTALSVEGNTNA